MPNNANHRSLPTKAHTLTSTTRRNNLAQSLRRVCVSCRVVFLSQSLLRRALANGFTHKLRAAIIAHMHMFASPSSLHGVLYSTRRSVQQVIHCREHAIIRKTFRIYALYWCNVISIEFEFKWNPSKLDFFLFRGRCGDLYRIKLMQMDCWLLLFSTRHVRWRMLHTVHMPLLTERARYTFRSIVN